MNHYFMDKKAEVQRVWGNCLRHRPPELILLTTKINRNDLG